MIVNLAAIGIVIAVYQDEVKQETSQQEVAAVFEKRKQELVGKRSVPRRWQR